MIQQMQQLPTMKTQLLFDLESTGLLRRGSRIHCIVMRDAVDGTASVFDHLPERALLQGVKQLEQADILIGHNIIVLMTSHSSKNNSLTLTPQGQAVDTLVLSLACSIPTLQDTRFRASSIRECPNGLYGRHSLGSLGLPTEVLQRRLRQSKRALGTPILPKCSELLRTRRTEVTLKLWQLYATEDG